MAKLLQLHASQVGEFVAAIKTDEKPVSRVQASPEQRTYGLQQARASGLKVQENGWTLPELNAALDVAFPDGNPLSLRKRMELKGHIHAGGLLLEAPDRPQSATWWLPR